MAAGTDDGKGASPDRDPGMPAARRRARPAAGAVRVGRLAGGPGALGPAGAAADELSGPERRCPGATDDELIGLLRAWAAIESWAAGAKLGVIRGDDAPRGPSAPGSDHGDLPETWSRSLRYELAGALACSTQSAETTASLAWELQARLPGIGARLDDGTLTFAKARAVVETFKYLTDADAAAAEALIADQLAGKTYTQVLRLAEQAALTVDPELAERRREQAQRKDARVSFFREQAGTAGLSGRDLPPDEALAAMASVNARAEEYQESGRVRRHPDGRAARLRLPRPAQRRARRDPDRAAPSSRTTPTRGRRGLAWAEAGQPGPGDAGAERGATRTRGQDPRTTARQPSATAVRDR